MVRIEAGRWTVVVAGTSGAHGVLLGEAGVETEGVAVPDVDGGVGERLAGSRVEHGDAEGERDAGFLLGDVGAKEFVGDVVGADFLLGEELADGGLWSEAERGGGALELQRGGESDGVGEEAATADGLVHETPGEMCESLLWSKTTARAIG
jgi:hypothetical protein